MILAEPIPAAIEAIRRHAPNGVCEIGAGEGLWLEAMMRAGIPCVGYDKAPRGPLVVFGDYYTAARHGDLALLAVWPPDNIPFGKWLAPWPGNIVMGCGDWLRSDRGEADWRSVWQEIDVVQVPPSYKGGSELRIFRRDAS